MPNLATPSTNRSVRAFLDRLERQEFYGALTLKYEAGRLIHIRKEENLKPTELLSGTPENYVDNRKS